MQFGLTPTNDALGAILAHSLRVGGQRFRKGRALSANDLTSLAAAGITDVTVARLEDGDVGEDEAARRIAETCAGAGVLTGATFTGRANLYAETSGLAIVDAERVRALNGIDESITFATLPPFARVTPRRMLGTVKIIPFAAPRAVVERAEAFLADKPVIRVAPFLPHAVALISTALPDTRPALLDKNRAALEARVNGLGSALVFEARVAHRTEDLAVAIAAAKNQHADPILVFGASAITDRRDIIPAAIVQAGGTIVHFGMPVDPGNLLLLGRIGDTAVIGLPGCARSPKLNGFDFVLWRLMAGLPLGRDEIAAMGVGGLLGEIATRPQPRDERFTEAPHAPRISGVILAAGLSSRMGRNKLLADLGGKPMLRHTAEAAAASQCDPIVVVTGNEAQAVEEALGGLRVRFVHNPDFAGGLSTSLKAGIAAVPEDCDGAMIILGDMPGVTTALIDRLIASFSPEDGRAICIASHGGKRGNPVLWARRFFAEMGGLAGDMGAKPLIAANEELVCEVEAGDDGPLTDIDTPDALARALQPR